MMQRSIPKSTFGRSGVRFLRFWGMFLGRSCLIIFEVCKNRPKKRKRSPRSSESKVSQRPGSALRHARVAWGGLRRGDKRRSGQDFSFKELGQGDLAKKDLAGLWFSVQHAVPRLGGGSLCAFRQVFPQQWYTEGS